MKRVILSLALFTGIFAACNKKEEPIPEVPATMEISAGDISALEAAFTAGAQSRTAQVVTNLSVVNVVSSHDWCEAEILDLNGFVLHISVRANEGFTNRNATVTVKGQGVTDIVVNISQLSIEPSLTVDKPDGIQIVDDNLEFSLTVTTNVSFTFNNSDWILDDGDNTPMIGTKTYDFRVDAINLGASRDGSIEIVVENQTLANLNKTIAVNQINQGLPSLTVDKNDIKIVDNDLEFTLTVVTNVEFSFNNTDWILDNGDNTPVVGTKTYQFKVAAIDPGESRDGTIGIEVENVAYESLNKTIAVNQTQSLSKAELQVDRSSFSLANFPGDYSTQHSSSYRIDYIWINASDQLWGSSVYISLVNGHPLPQWFTIDMGDEYELSRFKYYQRGGASGAGFRQMYAGGNMREFEVWGALDPDPSYNPNNHGGDFGPDWALLGSHVVQRPSGNFIAEGTAAERTDNTQEDYQAALAGHEILFNYAGKVRYLRIKCITNWDGTDRQFIQIGCIQLWAMQ